MIEFPENKVAVRNTYWGATNEEVRNSEKWTPDQSSRGASYGHLTYDGFYGHILESPCHLIYFYESIDGKECLSQISYYFALYSVELYDNLVSILAEMYGEMLGIVKETSEKYNDGKKPKIWLIDSDLTSVEIVIDKQSDGECIRIWYKYNGQDIRDRIIDYRKQTMMEFGGSRIGDTMKELVESQKTLIENQKRTNDILEGILLKI